MRSPLAAAIAIALGLIVLAGYFFPLPILLNVRTLLLGWGVTLLGIATLVGIANLVVVHWRKMRRNGGKDLYSPVLILAFLLTFAAGVWFTPAHPQYQRIVTAIQVPVETSLLALLAVTLAFASLRLVQRRKGWMPVVFLVSAVLFLLLASGMLPVSTNTPVLGDLFAFLNRLPLAGARGILLGVALGSITTGLRILLGADRPYSG
ncbi:MAG: hypothetical protein HPY76_10455 [Anaerolineae bacterium]|nr:hypothetical protein [Anaerolineae bacterium]